MKLFITFILLLGITYSKILIILDNSHLKDTHSQFFKSLESISHVQYAYSFNKQKIELKAFDKFKYDHIVVMCTSQKQMESKIKVREIVNYFDQGGNVIVVGDLDISRSFRKLYYAFGIDLEQSGNILKDNFSKQNRSDTVVTRNFQTTYPFIDGDYSKLPLIYRGIGMSIVNYQNYQLYNLVKAQPTTYSLNVNTKKVSKVGSKISLVAAIQGLNNARAIFSGSLDFFSNQFFDKPNYGNRQYVNSLVRWAFQQKGIIRVRDMHYHGIGSNQKQTLFNIGQKIIYKVHAQQLNFNNNQWKPYITNDLQIQFVMLDPWVRSTLINQNNSQIYSTSFYAPQKQGIYQFKIIYKKPGYNFITQSQRVTVRPYKHDQFERFIFVAFPYLFGLVSTIVGTFIFIVFYLYSGFGKSKSE